jgi:hypothetical protein
MFGGACLSTTKHVGFSKYPCSETRLGGVFYSWDSLLLCMLWVVVFFFDHFLPVIYLSEISHGFWFTKGSRCFPK